MVRRAGSFWKQDTQDPVVGAIKLSQATETLEDALSRLPALAKQLETPKRASAIGRARAPVTWQLALDELEDTGVDLRPRLPSRRAADSPGAHATPRLPAAAKPLSEILQSLKLDPLTVADDPDYLPSLAVQRNPPQFVKDALAAFYK